MTRQDKHTLCQYDVCFTQKMCTKKPFLSHGQRRNVNTADNKGKYATVASFTDASSTLKAAPRLPLITSLKPQEGDPPANRDQNQDVSEDRASVPVDCAAFPLIFGVVLLSLPSFFGGVLPFLCLFLEGAAFSSLPLGGDDLASSLFRVVLPFSLHFWSGAA